MTDRLPDLAARPRRRRLSASSLSALWCCFERQSERRLWAKALGMPEAEEAEAKGAGGGDEAECSTDWGGGGGGGPPGV